MEGGTHSQSMTGSRQFAFRSRSGQEPETLQGSVPIRPDQFIDEDESQTLSVTIKDDHAPASAFSISVLRGRNVVSAYFIGRQGDLRAGNNDCLYNNFSEVQ